MLNGIRIPLSAFTGDRPESVTSVEFGFGTPAMGSIQLGDVMFQETPKAAPGAARAGVTDVDPVHPSLTARRRSRRDRSSTPPLVAAPTTADAREPEGHVRGHGQADQRRWRA